MKEELIRTEMLLGRAAIERLQHSHVAVFGIGGVGGYVTEVLARSGVGELTLIDSDRVNRSNINRQIIATMKQWAGPKWMPQRNGYTLSPRIASYTLCL